MAKSAKGKTKLVQSVDRALSMLEVLASEPKGLTLSQLSKKLGLLPQTAQGLVRTLQAHEMVSQADSGMP
ncbi:MAG: helix-turn-helix domain-containing protein, partial [Phycisphaerae bacterium]|nr:helix-turn-helix domain-containing protein [Phycisphaerae bacterium]